MSKRAKKQANGHKALETITPQARKNLKQRLQQLGTTATEISRGAVMGVCLGAVAAPLAALGAGPLAAALTGIAGGVGGNLLANLIQRFYDAEQSGDNQEQTRVIDEILTLLQQNSEDSQAVAQGLQALLERIDALAAVQQTLAAQQAELVKSHLGSLRLIPADLPAHRDFARQVRRYFQLQRVPVQDGFYLGGEQLADFLVTRIVDGEPLRTVVQCVTTAQGRADEQMLAKLTGWLPTARSQGKVERGLIVTDKGLSPAAQGQAEGAGWQVRRYDNLMADLLDFSLYLDTLRDQVERPRPDSGLPALQAYYVPLTAKHERGDKDEEPFDLFTYVSDWITQPSPAPPLMLLGEYGTGKTTFSRVLAARLAKQVQQARDRDQAAAAGHSRPRLPILINLLHFAETRNMHALLTHYLDHVCQVRLPSFELFQQLNAEGAFVLILDGFDEMAVRVDSQTIEKHLYEIEQLARPKESRVILTGRPEFFMSREEMEEALWRHKHILSQRFKNYDALRVQLWDDDQILAFLEGLVPHLANNTLGKDKQPGSAQDYFDRIQKISGLRDVSQRAVLLEMVAKTLPRLGEDSDITRPALYATYLRGELERQRLQKGRTLLLDDETRLALLQELAADSFTPAAGGSGITFPAARERMRKKLAPEQRSTELQVEQHTREFLGCSFLRPGPDNLFVFSHRSFRGYLAAQELARRLRDGSAKPQPIDQDCIGFLAELLAPICTPEWYRGQVAQALKKDGLPQWIERRGDGFVSALPDGTEVEMVYVPAGPFVLGVEGLLPPQIAVLPAGVWLDKTPVTNAQYRAFLEANPEHREPHVDAGWARPYNWKERRYPKELADHPVVLVNWDDAQAFCAWAGKALPNEQQWEKAARGIDGRTWPWGDAWDGSKCNSASRWAERDLWDYEKEWKPWWDDTFFPRVKQGKEPFTSSVQEYEKWASPYGCCDCAGNVWEWCADLWKEGETERVLRGGAWSNPPGLVACAFRSVDAPDYRGDFVGFRPSRTR